jgi:hypothetical protein
MRHDRDRVAEPLGLLDVVRRHEDRDAFRPERRDERPDLLPHLRVEADGRLVQEHQPRTVDEPAGDQEPSAHAAGELVHPGVPSLDQVRHRERALDRRAPLGAADPVEVREHDQVLLDRERRVEVVELRDDAALGARLLRLARQAVAEHLDLPLIGDRLGGQHLHRGRLAGAVRPEQADARPLRDVEIQSVDGRDGAVALHDPAHAERERRLFGQVLGRCHAAQVTVAQPDGSAHGFGRPPGGNRTVRDP